MITEKDLRYLRVAESASYLSDYPRVHIGACLVKRNDIVSIGFNKVRTHPEQLKYNRHFPYTPKLPRIHAEIDAIIKAGDESEGSTLYVFRRGLDDLQRNCKPCASCSEKIADAGVKRVVYTTEDGISEAVVD